MLSSALSRELTRPLPKREFDRLKRLEPAIEEIQRTHRDNPKAGQEATMKLYEENDVNAFRGCLWGLAGPVAAFLPALWSRRHQTLADRVAGIIVVRE
jgi:membrane protein insertase Oxa1/YidC/SpoIIIJ